MDVAMLLLLRSRRASIYAPSSFLGLSAVMMVGATWRCVVDPTIESFVAVAFAFAIATFAASLVVAGAVRDGRLCKRSLFATTELDVRAPGSGVGSRAHPPSPG